MKSNILLYPSLMLLAGMAAGCHEDDGNYNYIDLDEVEISVDEDNLASVYDLGENINVVPTIKFNGRTVVNEDDAPLSYVWTLYAAGTGEGIDYTIDTLSTTIALDASMTRPGSNILQLTVTNENTGIETYYRKACAVSSAVSGGWMLLYERADNPGYSDIGLVVNPTTRIGETNNKELWNLYSAVNGEPLPGKPVSIIHNAIPLSSGGIDHVATEETIKLLSATEFNVVKDWSDMFYEPIEGSNIQYYATNTMMNSSFTLIVDGSMRLNAVDAFSAQRGDLGTFSLAKRADEPIGEIANWSAKRCNGNSILESVIYSQTNSKFYYNTGTLELRQFFEQDEEAAFDVNDMQGARLLFGDFGGAQEDFMLFANGNNRYIGIATFSGYATANTRIGNTFTDVSSAPDITEAVTFSTGEQSYFAYYAAKNKVYRVACITGEAQEAWTAPDPDEVVTCVRNHKYYFATVGRLIPDYGNWVYISTWNESKHEGKLYMYKINAASFQIYSDQDHYEYTVPGKVKDMSLKFEMIMI